MLSSEEKIKLYDYIENSLMNNKGILSDDAVHYLHENSMLTSHGSFGWNITYIINDLHYEDNHGKYQVILQAHPKKHKIGFLYVGYKVGGNYQEDGTYSIRTNMFCRENRLQDK